MISIKDITDNGNLLFDHIYTEDQYVYFKSVKDGHIYVANAVTRRYYRYNGGGENGKRISGSSFNEQMDALEARKHDSKSYMESTDENHVNGLNIDELAAGVEEDFNSKSENELPEGYEITSVWDGDSTVYMLNKGDSRIASAYEYDELVKFAADFENNGLTEEQENAVDKVVEEELDEEIKGITKEMAPKKARKPRAKKVQVGGYEFTWDEVHVILTPKQVDFIQHLPDTDFYENGTDSAMWVDVLCDQIGGQFKDKPMTVGAMISTLREKGLIVVGVDHVNGHKAKFFEFTVVGKKIATELGLQ